MLRDARDGAFDAASGILNKILANIQKSPEEEKYRKIRGSNPKIAEMLATSGIKAILTGAGFVQEGEFFTLPAGANLDLVAAAIAGLAEQAADRKATDTARKDVEAAKRMEQDKENEEERKRMKMGISDDAAARKEPGWTAKAAGVKGGREITGCSDVGIGNSSGG